MTTLLTYEALYLDGMPFFFGAPDDEAALSKAKERANDKGLILANVFQTGVESVFGVKRYCTPRLVYALDEDYYNAANI